MSLSRDTSFEYVIKTFQCEYNSFHQSKVQISLNHDQCKSKGLALNKNIFQLQVKAFQINSLNNLNSSLTINKNTIIPYFLCLSFLFLSPLFIFSLSLWKEFFFLFSFFSFLVVLSSFLCFALLLVLFFNSLKNFQICVLFIFMYLSSSL